LDVFHSDSKAWPGPEISQKKKWADGKNRTVHFGGMHPAGGG
jgi:hypothetical protein